ncbi:hybrid-cluster NAD(P)-dependent oxidoreductase [Vibrio methylphosphonaticus]|uniref:hybrid-cluster NAD(P)-dependent oxidoreductase n=1 Tax=Vibrio methylphosphonaticus TaxID=2946866 RepID=UPI00202AA01F|nr:hybrid-cluster NAD(P)-dependent oxidoreductase [Vibrio methylphosphonaticus]MCL9773680.1 hybrid-cluster NAD(P)-dependent oxidoreductase [Vibrio methylphosphonaticus]
MAWSQSGAVELTCTKKWVETPDSVTFELSPNRHNVTFQFKPGQFSSLGFDIEGDKHFRAYSISSKPGDSKLRFTVKRVANGLVSNHVVEQLEVGQLVEAMAPIGKFNNVDCSPQDKVLMISAGCGITPVMSMVDDWLASDTCVDIEFLHLAKSKQDAIYFNKISRLNDSVEHFNLKMLLEDSSGTDYPQGLISLEWLQTLVADFHDRTIYLCGPTGFMQVVKSALEQADFDMSNFHQESFTPAEPEPVVQDTAPEISQHVASVKVMVPDFGVELDAEAGSLLLDALEKGGVPVIAACRSGICGSCKCKVKVGQVLSSSKETLTEQDIENGFVLACSSQIQSDVEVALT